VLLFEGERGFDGGIFAVIPTYAINKDGDFTAGAGIQLNAAGGKFKGSLDVFNGGDGFDTLLATGGHDVVFRYALDDSATRTGSLVNQVEELQMGGGDDVVDLTSPLFGVAGADESFVIYGESGRDALWTGAGTDTLYGGDDGDWLSGGAGDDVLYGGNTATGGDTNTPSSGTFTNGWTMDGFGTRVFNDVLDGGTGNDLLYGGSGNDLLSGGAGIDTLTGNNGADYFVFRIGATSWGQDTVTDFDYGAGDRLVASGWNKGAVSSAFLGSGDLQLSFSGNSITLAGFDSTDLTAAGGVGNLFA
jgi:Ca2+-binding RTX toxin-like protein